MLNSTDIQVENPVAIAANATGDVLHVTIGIRIRDTRTTIYSRNTLIAGKLDNHLVSFACFNGHVIHVGNYGANCIFAIVVIGAVRKSETLVRRTSCK